MKIDLNEPGQAEMLKKAAKSPNGQLILDFLKDKADELDYEKIEIENSCQTIGEEFKATRKARKFIDETIKFLTGN